MVHQLHKYVYSISTDSETNSSSEEFECELTAVDLKESNRETRSKPMRSEAIDEQCDRTFPKVYVRSRRKSINEKIIRAFTQCLADFKVSMDDLSGIFVNVATVIFDQNWTLDEPEIECENCVESDTETEEKHVESRSKRSKATNQTDMKNQFQKGF